MNKAILIGRLTKDADIRQTTSGTMVAKFTLAIDRRKKEDGTKETDFISCQAWGKRAELIEKYVHKGDKIGLCGQIRTGSYEKDGRKVYTTDVVVDELEFLEKSEKRNDNPQMATEEAGYFDFDESDLPF